jgi:hypothetical protein
MNSVLRSSLYNVRLYYRSNLVASFLLLYHFLHFSCPTILCSSICHWTSTAILLPLVLFLLYFKKHALLICVINTSSWVFMRSLYRVNKMNSVGKRVCPSVRFIISENIQRILMTFYIGRLSQKLPGNLNFCSYSTVFYLKLNLKFTF